MIIFGSILENFDIYGHKVEIFIDSKRKVKSKFAAFISIIIISICLLFFSLNLQSWLENKTLQTVSSAQSLEVNQLLLNNKSFPYEFNFKNFNLYFALTAMFPNGTVRNFWELQKYITQSIVYTDQYQIEKNIPLGKCYQKQKNAFLDPESYQNQSLNDDFGPFSNWTVCINENLPMGLFADAINSVVNYTTISFRIAKCRNTTKNNFSCASNEEISEILRYVTIQISLPKSVYDFNNPTSPRKRTYAYQIYHMDFNLVKWFSTTLIPTYLQTDYGIISEDYNLRSVDFNAGGVLYETMIRNTKDLNDEIDDTLLRFDLSIGFDQQIYYQKNQKIYIFFANLGGIMNVFFFIGQLICYSYNYVVYLHKLINNSFVNLENSENAKMEKGKYKKIEKGFKFKPFSILLPFFFKRKLYDEALKSLHEYLDINNIVKKLQDIDKMKMILFDENQRELFEVIPKPGIIGNNTKPIGQILTMKSITSRKSTKKITDINKKILLSDDNPITKRLLGLIEPKLINQFFVSTISMIFFNYLSLNFSK